MSPNFVGTPSLTTSTREHPTPGGNLDAYQMAPYLTSGSRASVVPAWQFIQAVGGFSRVKVAIIDDGFWFDGAGRPMSSLTPWVSDLPSRPEQYDFGTDSFVVGGPNRGHCTGGGACPWHGNGSAGTAVGTLDNGYGGAGTGGLVADPLIFASEITWDQVARAIRTAVAWHAAVVSMSFGMECDNVFCDGYFEFNLYPALRNARDNAVVTVAAAGNDGQSTHSVPCKGDSVICVGALADGTNTAIDYSNFGPSVDIWAPTDITVMPDGASAGLPALHNGTSASAPFVAGVVAMLKAYDGSLTSDQVNDILQRTAWTDSSDPKVGHSINAYRALREVTGALDAPPDLQLVVPTSVHLHRSFAVRTHTFDLEDGSPCCTVTWDPAPLYSTDSGREATLVLDTAGAHTVTATATDRHGNATTARVTVVATDDPPVTTIFQPTASDVVLAGQPVQLAGGATDLNEGPGPGAGPLDCSALQWTSSSPLDTQFPLYGCNLSVTFAGSGYRVLTLTARDPDGSATHATVSLSVGVAPVNYPPVVTVGGLPAQLYNGDGLTWDQELDVTASATDPEGDTPLTYQWFVTTYQPLSTTAVYGFTTQVSTSQNLAWTPQLDAPSLFGDFAALGNACYQGEYVKLEVQVTDSLGHATRRTVADPASGTLPKLKIYRCVLM